MKKVPVQQHRYFPPRPVREQVARRIEHRHMVAIRGLSVVIIVGIVIALVWLACGCTSTVIPVKVKPAVASFDGNAQNSGFIRFNKDGSGVISPHARERYNALCQAYGARFVPPVSGVDSGITPDGAGNFLIDAEHLAKFAEMNLWKKEGK